MVSENVAANLGMTIRALPCAGTLPPGDEILVRCAAYPSVRGLQEAIWDFLSDPHIPIVSNIPTKLPSQQIQYKYKYQCKMLAVIFYVIHKYIPTISLQNFPLNKYLLTH